MSLLQYVIDNQAQILSLLIEAYKTDSNFCWSSNFNWSTSRDFHFICI